MPLWGNTDAAASAPKFAGALNKKTANLANQTLAFGNTSIGVTGVFGVNAAEASAAANDGKIAHTGWVARKYGTGPIANVVIAAAGTGYANTDTFVVASPTGGTNAAGTITTNGSGVITATALTSGGAGFSSVNNSVTITTSGGSGATLTGVAGGRAGRVQTEVLVAMNTITGDASDDALFPDS